MSELGKSKSKTQEAQAVSTVVRDSVIGSAVGFGVWYWLTQSISKDSKRPITPSYGPAPAPAPVQPQPAPQVVKVVVAEPEPKPELDEPAPETAPLEEVIPKSAPDYWS
jgi:hypothetical protein